VKKPIYTIIIASLILLPMGIGISSFLKSKNTDQYALSRNSQVEAQKKKTIVIDPGHGGNDPGSLGKKGTLEKDVNLAVALKLGPILEEKGYRVVYTRETDKTDWNGQKEGLLERAAISNKAKADLFISIHINSSEYKNIRGVETYYKGSSPEGEKLAQLVQTEIINQTVLKDRGIKKENFLVLNNVKAPAILVELGYISTPAEEEVLKNSQYHIKYASGIANGVFKYFEEQPNEKDVR
jgi:N-acetylmuramoyl-L-alanine amidase